MEELWVWAMLVDDSPAVLSLGILCTEHGFSYVWESGQQPKLSRGPTTVTCETENFAPVVTLSVDHAAPAEHIEAVSSAENNPKPEPLGEGGEGDKVSSEDAHVVPTIGENVSP